AAAPAPPRLPQVVAAAIARATRRSAARHGNAAFPACGNTGRAGAGQMRRSGREMAVMEPQLPRTSLFDAKTSGNRLMLFTGARAVVRKRGGQDADTSSPEPVGCRW